MALQGWVLQEFFVKGLSRAPCKLGKVHEHYALFFSFEKLTAENSIMSLFQALFSRSGWFR